MEKVGALIERVMDLHPFAAKVTPAKELKYYTAVHQELGPLARALEREVERLNAVIHEYERAKFTKKKTAVTHIWTCNNCGNVYRGGQSEVTVFAEHGRVHCRVCVGSANAKDTFGMTETTEPK